MPHSSGGGSHSGGSHSSSSYSGGSSGRSTPAVYRSYHSGTRRYVYYQNNRPYYYYSTEKVEEPSKATLPLLIVLFIVAILISIPLWTLIVDTPQKLEMDYDTNIVIADNLDIMTEAEESELSMKLKEFQDVTGITPAVLTVSNDEWKPYYEGLENYAYDYYVNAFSDEKHWLIVYSTDSGTKFEDWYWEGMQGDSTDYIITSSVVDRFNDVMQKELTSRTKYSVKDSISDSFSEVLPTIMDKSIDWEFVILMVVVDGFVLIFFISQIISTKTAKKRSNSYACKTSKEQPIEDTCSYCGGVYVHGIHISCPHCGAPIVALKRKDEQAGLNPDLY